MTSPDDTIFPFGKVLIEQIGDLVSKSLTFSNGTTCTFEVDSNSYILNLPKSENTEYPYFISI